MAAAEAWTARADALIFTQAPWMQIVDPLDRVLAHIDFRAALMDGPAESFTCFVGTLVQESFATSDVLRQASNDSITAYSERFAKDIDAAIAAYGIKHDITAIGLAYHVQAVLQGAFILAKAKADASVARDSAEHLKRYIKSLFGEAKLP